MWNYFEFGPAVQEKMSFKDILSGALAALLFGGTICAIFKQGIIGNIHVKLYEILTSCLGDVI